jgi:DNA-binding PadR family transcriptional regulator
MPLSPVVFDILVTLAAGDAHGYAILTDIRERSGETLRPGSLYRALNRLLDEQLIEERPASGAKGDDGRRTYYRLTAAGRREAQIEAKRLDAQVRTARNARLLNKAR